MLTNSGYFNPSAKTSVLSEAESHLFLLKCKNFFTSSNFSGLYSEQVDNFFHRLKDKKQSPGGVM